MKTLCWLGIIAAAIAGCNTPPRGYERVKPAVRPGGRAIAVLPFAVLEGSGITAVDSVQLAEYTAIGLRANLPGITVLGPSNLWDALKGGMNEARWPEIARLTGTQLLVVGEITYLSAQYDELLQSREGMIAVSFRVLDATSAPAKLIQRIAWRLNYPEDREDKFDPRYTTMDEAMFRNEILRYMAQRIGGAFYEHLEKKRPVNQVETTLRVEGPEP